MKDNYMRKYFVNFRNKMLEDVIRKAICQERDFWRTPYWIADAEEYPFDFPEEEKRYKKVFWGSEDSTTIRQRLEEDDAKYRSTSYAKRFQSIRVPSMKRSNKEWENFYRTFPFVAVKVAIGKERFLDGAKLKYIPLFKKILDEEWPENLKMWTVYEYENLIQNGIIELSPREKEIFKKLID